MEIAALIISIISFIAVLYQNLKMKATLDNQIYASFVNNSLEIDHILIEYPEIRKYVYGGAPVDKNTPDIDRMLSVMELIIDVTENIEVYKRYIPKTRRDGWLAFVKDVKGTPLYEYYQCTYSSWYEVKE